MRPYSLAGSVWLGLCAGLVVTVVTLAHSAPWWPNALPQWLANAFTVLVALITVIVVVVAYLHPHRPLTLQNTLLSAAVPCIGAALAIKMHLIYAALDPTPDLLMAWVFHHVGIFMTNVSTLVVSLSLGVACAVQDTRSPTNSTE